MFRSRESLFAAAVAVMIVASVATIAAAPSQDTPAPPARGRRASPPQPQQQQGLDYFIGTWTFTWTGRESPISSGPRTGSVTYSRIGDGTSAEMRAEGTSDAGGAFKESGVLRWNDATKTLTVQETLANNVQMSSVGNWSSPISIIVESQPIQVQGQLVRLKRTYSILSGTSFRVTDELSTNGGAFSRLGVGDFRKSQK